MVSVPGMDRSVDEDKELLEAIRKMIAVLKILCKHLPSVKVGPWIGSSKKEEDKLLTELPEDVNVVNRFTFNFN